MRLKVNICIFCLRIIIKPYHFVMLLKAEDTELQFCLILLWPLLSRDTKYKMFWLATIRTSQMLFLLVFVIWNTVIHHCILLRLRLFHAFESHF